VKESRLMIVGLGNVGQALLHIIRDDADFFENRFGVRFKVVAVNDMRLGSLYDPNGLSLPALLAGANAGDLTSVQAAQHDWSVETMLEQADADTLVEASFHCIAFPRVAFLGPKTWCKDWIRRHRDERHPGHGIGN
jgi:homoserine dehydrogenase